MADSQRKTANLFDGATAYGAMYSDGVITGQGNAIYAIKNKVTADMIGKTYTISLTPLAIVSRAFLSITINGTAYWRDKELTVNQRSSFQFTPVTENDLWAISYNEAGVYSYKDIMVNEGSTPLPYEPYGWLHSLRKLGTSTDTITNLPAVLYPNDTTATVGLKGNMYQTGTPTPTTPIQPSETGDETANLLDVTLFHNGYHINSQGNIETFTGRIATTTPIDVSNYTSVTFSYTTTRDNDNFIYATFSGNTLVERVAGKTSGFTIDTTNCDKLYLCLYNLSSQVLTADIITAMLNDGSTPLPYEPYGYKIPISSASTTTPVYLGEVESTRRIKKYVFTGDETVNGTISSTESGTSVYSVRYDTIGMEDIIDYDSPMPYISYPIFICSHFKMKTNTSFDTPYTAIKNGEIGANSVANNTYNRYVIFASNQYTSVDTFKEYLAAQYAAGTPVTVWYVLANETTGIVNEPLRKIGDYADTVSGISIPTITGADSFDVLTTLKPSEVSLTYTGWHDASVGEWDGSEWQ